MRSKKKLNCPLCEKVFPNYGELGAHSTSHTKEKPHKCLICSAAFGLKDNLKKHIRTVHDGVKRIYKTKIKCSSCDYECGTRAKMKDHSRKHSAERPFTCNKLGCDYSTKYKGNLRKHVRVEHDNLHPFKCPSDGCSYQSKYLGGVKSHLKIHSKEKPFSCTFSGCNKTFKREPGLKDHIVRAHSSEKPFKCLSCDFETKHKATLRHHEDDHKNIKRFHCRFPNCNRTSNFKTDMQRHYDSKHGKKIVICTAAGCNFRFGSIALLNTHKKIHFLPILKCPHGSCSFSTKNPTNLRKHIACRHGNDESVLQMLPRSSRLLPAGQLVEPNQLVCRFGGCGYQTEFLHLYERYMQTHGKNTGKYTCRFCPKRFPAYWALERHIQSHTGERALIAVCIVTTRPLVLKVPVGFYSIETVSSFGMGSSLCRFPVDYYSDDLRKILCRSETTK